jgi:glyoxylate utilization-related uncharacterized protein
MATTHCLIYVLSGAIDITEQDNTTTIDKGECAFIRKDNRINMVKRPKGDEQWQLKL